MSAVKAVVEKLDDVFTIKTIPGKGTQFLLRIPGIILQELQGRAA